MSPADSKSPAEIASEAALAAVFSAIDRGKSFLLEAGAGAGKTYSLVRALGYLITKRGNEILRGNQKIACITFTNVASDEISSRTDGHPAILSSTIHAFCWSLIKNFQNDLRRLLPSMRGWPERIEEAGGIAGNKIVYDLGYPAIKNDEVLLGHTDVILLTAKLMESAKFRQLMCDQYPVLFIDEYQDTNKDFVEAVKQFILGKEDSPLVGFFGDHWQKIYGDGCGAIQHPSLERIGKKANFRSAPPIVKMLNTMRPQLPQEVKDPLEEGWIDVYHTNLWRGERRKEAHWKGDLPPAEAHRYLEELKKLLLSQGWVFEPDHTKILMLTHNLLAKEQGYAGIAEAFEGKNDRFIKKEDPHIEFLVDVVEPVCIAYQQKRFGEMFSLLKSGPPPIATHTDKEAWKKDMDVLLKLRVSGKIGEVMDHMKLTKRPRLPEAVEKKENKLALPAEKLDPGEEQSIERLRTLREVPYFEIPPLARFINDQTPFSTKHGVKGAQFDNVLVVFGRGWNQYDFNQMLELAGKPIPSNKLDSFERNRNLFYVVCSRPRKRLAVLFTHQLSVPAMAQLSAWFGSSNIHSLPA